MNKENERPAQWLVPSIVVGAFLWGAILWALWEPVTYYIEGMSWPLG